VISGQPRPIDLHAIRARIDAGEGQAQLHPIGLGSLVVGDDALQRLPSIVDLLARPGPIVVLVDRTSMRHGDLALKPEVLGLLAPRDARIVVLCPDEPELHADPSTIAVAVEACRDAGCVVGLGSGTVCDIGKEASREVGAPYVVVQTAGSVNAFADDMAVLLLGGVKRTVPSRWPDALLIDLSVVADAPPELNRSGVGELAATFTAPADWYLASATGLDASYDERVVGLFADRRPALLAAAPGLGRQVPDRAALGVLCELMTLTGLAMGVAGRTAPVSGTEHTVSHLIDMAAARTGRPTGLHGSQVGVAAIAVAVAWQHFLEEFDPASLRTDRDPGGAAARSRTERAFERLDPSGGMAAECWREYSRKLDQWQSLGPRLDEFIDEWDLHRTELARLVASPLAIATALREAGAPATFADLEPAVDPATATWALLNGHLLRDRASIADVAWFAGIWTEALVESVIDEAAAVTSGR
jgi:glycerol-1-phosphate dehydrogenase [NAD(P)+]